jgi:hypothetical protein
MGVALMVMVTDLVGLGWSPHRSVSAPHREEEEGVSCCRHQVAAEYLRRRFWCLMSREWSTRRVVAGWWMKQSAVVAVVEWG